MDFLIEFLMSYGYLGMAVAAFIAGSFFPFSSEAVLLGLMAAGLDPWELVVWATVGNTLGSYFNYCIGRLGRIDWIEKYLHVRKEKLDETVEWMQGRGALMGLLAALPIIGTATCIGLGLMRANIPIAMTTIFISKVVRYIILVYATQWMF